MERREGDRRVERHIKPKINLKMEDEEFFMEHIVWIRSHMLNTSAVLFGLADDAYYADMTSWTLISCDLLVTSAIKTFNRLRMNDALYGLDVNNARHKLKPPRILYV